MEAARAKIQAMLKEHDLMGCIIIAGKERAGFFSFLSPTWSVASIEEDADGQMGVLIKCLASDYPDQQAQLEHIASTVNGIMGLLHVHEFIGDLLKGMLKLFASKFNIQTVVDDANIQDLAVADEPPTQQIPPHLRG